MVESNNAQGVVDVTDRKALEVWLEGLPRRAQTTFVARAALRSLPAAMAALDQKIERFDTDNFLLACFRATMISGVASTWPTPEMSDEIRASAADSAVLSEYPEQTRDLFESWLWPEQTPPEPFDQNWQAFATQAEGSVWPFWRDWYQGMLDGKPLDWDLQTQIALIPNADWEKGPTHIAAMIEKIRKRFDLEQRIAELEQDLVTTSATRRGIGGNNPPDPIDDGSPVAKELLIVWAPLQDLKVEIAADDPNPARIQKAIQALQLALKTGLAWCASKADLAVDTGIKCAVAAGVGYFAMNPDQIAAVIEAAQAWLHVLP